MINPLFNKLEKAKSQRSIWWVVLIILIILRAIPSKIITSILSPIIPLLTAIGPTGFGILAGIVNILPLFLIIDVVYLTTKIGKLRKQLIKESICERCGHPLSGDGLKCSNCSYNKEDEKIILMAWLKENWFKFGILIIILILGGVSFYWFQYRPSQIKKSCDEIARIKAHAKYCEDNHYFNKDLCINFPTEDQNKVNIDSYNFNFKSCLNKYGL